MKCREMELGGRIVSWYEESWMSSPKGPTREYLDPFIQEVVGLIGV